jgi:hypothetical protein
MPFRMRRSSTRGTPRGLLGSSGSIAPFKSVRSHRLISTLNQISVDMKAAHQPSSGLGITPAAIAAPYARATKSIISLDELDTAAKAG